MVFAATGRRRGAEVAPRSRSLFGVSDPKPHGAALGGRAGGGFHALDSCPVGFGGRLLPSARAEGDRDAVASATYIPVGHEVVHAIVFPMLRAAFRKNCRQAPATQPIRFADGLASAIRPGERLMKFGSLAFVSSQEVFLTEMRVGPSPRGSVDGEKPIANAASGEDFEFFASGRVEARVRVSQEWRATSPPR